MNTPLLTTFSGYLLVIMGLALFAYRQTHTLSDYILGGRRLSSGVAALSAGASDMSGWLLLGLPGAFYSSGLNQIWLAIGLFLGAYLNWRLVAPRLRIATSETYNSLTLPDFLHQRFADQAQRLRVISAVVILLFFTFYTSAGLVSGARLFESSFGLDYRLALWIGTIIIMLYTFIGGFLAVSWTDVFQGLLMVAALIIVPLVTLHAIGGWEATLNQMQQPDYLDILANTSLLGIISLLAWGLGYFGQPHILARFMAIYSPQAIPKARTIALSWMLVSLLGASLTGIIGSVYFAATPLADPEKVLLVLSQVLFNPWVAGVLLAAILSAIMSTLDSQLLVSSTTVTEDFYKVFLRPKASQAELMWVERLAVIAVALIALAIAHNPQSQIFALVGYAWAGFGSSFGPVIILSLFWPRMTGKGALAGLIVGAVVVVVWQQLTQHQLIPFVLYEMVPGFMLSLSAIVIVSLLDTPPKPIQD